MATNLESLAHFDNIQAHLSPKTELIVLFFFDIRDSTGRRMKTFVNSWSGDDDDDYKDRVLFIECNEETCNHDIFEKYNVQARPPTFLFIKNNKQVAPPYTVGADLSISAEKIGDVMDGLLNGNK